MEQPNIIVEVAYFTNKNVCILASVWLKCFSFGCTCISFVLWSQMTCLKLRWFSKTSFEKVKPMIPESHFESKALVKHFPCILQSALFTEKRRYMKYHTNHCRNFWGYTIRRGWASITLANTLEVLTKWFNFFFFFSVGGPPGLFFQPYRKPKRIRTAFSPSQLLQLEKSFEKSHYVVGQERKDLAGELQLSETQVRRIFWFFR